MTPITITGLTKHFAKTDAPAVADLSLAVEAGSFTCILGPSGCGKSTLLRMIAGLERSDAGQIALGDRVVDGSVFVAPERRGVGLVFQSYALWPHLTVFENIAFGLRLQRMNAAARKARVAEMVALLRIEGLEGRYPSQLSGGQQQRVALARTLALEPDVLLLDEPLSNLDAALRLQMREELARLHQISGTTIVLVTHDQWEAMSLSTHIAVMDAGRLQQFGTALDIYDRPANRFVAEFVGSPPINLIPQGSLAVPSLGGGTYESGIRPEAIQIAASGTPARVTELIPTGGSWITKLSLEDGDQTLLMSSASRPAIAPGEAVHITVDPSGIHQFDQAGNRVVPGPAPATRPKVASPISSQTYG